MPTIGGRKPDANDNLQRIAKKLLGRVDGSYLELPDKDETFLRSVTERYDNAPFVFSDAQREWIEDLEEKFL